MATPLSLRLCLSLSVCDWQNLGSAPQLIKNNCIIPAVSQYLNINTRGRPPSTWQRQPANELHHYEEALTWGWRDEGQMERGRRGTGLLGVSTGLRLFFCLPISTVVADPEMKSRKTEAAQFLKATINIRMMKTQRTRKGELPRLRSPSWFWEQKPDDIKRLWLHENEGGGGATSPLASSLLFVPFITFSVFGCVCGCISQLGIVVYSHLFDICLQCCLSVYLWWNLLHSLKGTVKWFHKVAKLYSKASSLVLLFVVL